MNGMRNLHLATLATLFSLLFAGTWAVAEEPNPATLDVPKIALSNIEFSVSSSLGAENSSAKGIVLRIGEKAYSPMVTEGSVSFESISLEKGQYELQLVSATGLTLARSQIRVVPGWLSLLPSLLAIGAALLLRQVIPALLLGVWSAAFLTYGLSIEGIWLGFFDVGGVFVLGALYDKGHLSVIVFSLLIGGLVGIISKNGGMAGIVRSVSGFANSQKRGQLATAFLGTAIFFDDYANTLVVGNTMRAITDRLKISREKLAYIVDSTAAPVASIAIVTTWIGFQVGLIDQSISTIPEISQSAYSIFLSSIPFSFYSIFAILFVYLIAISGRDFGPMYKAEIQARREERIPDSELVIAENSPDMQPNAKAYLAAIPLLVLIFGTFAGIYVTGRGAGSDAQSLQDIIGNGDAYLAMIWASSLAVLVATILTLARRSLSLPQTLDAFLEGVKSLIFAMLVLTLAWALSGANEVIQTANFLSANLADSIAPALFPVTIFVLAALMAFATGSSWAVMGIMVPLVVPLAWAVLSSSTGAGEPIPMYILYSSVAALLSGSVWGDHCSPISDTTILSSMASGCDHIEHVRTQLPYAVVVSIIAILIGVIPSGYGLSPWISLLFGGALMAGLLFLLGKKVPETKP
jgi:Na+/H+ antiporter NhaC